MRTAHLLLASPGMHCWGGGGVPAPGGVPAWGVPVPGVYLPGGCSWLRRCTCWGVYLPGVYLLGGVPVWGLYLPRGVYLPGVYLPGACTCWGVYLSGGCTCLEGVSAWGCTCWGVYLSGGCTCLGCTCPGGCTCPDTPHLWTEFLTHATENITLPQTLFAGGKNTLCRKFSGVCLFRGDRKILTGFYNSGLWEIFWKIDR